MNICCPVSLTRTRTPPKQILTLLGSPLSLHPPGVSGMPCCEGPFRNSENNRRNQKQEQDFFLSRTSFNCSVSQPLHAVTTYRFSFWFSLRLQKNKVIFLQVRQFLLRLTGLAPFYQKTDQNQAIQKDQLKSSFHSCSNTSAKNLK